MKKKSLVLLLTFMLVILCACGKDDKSDNNGKAEVSDAEENKEDNNHEDGIYEFDVEDLEVGTVLFEKENISLIIEEIRPNAEDSSCYDIWIKEDNHCGITYIIKDGKTDDIHVRLSDATITTDLYQKVKDTLILSILPETN